MQMVGRIQANTHLGGVHAYIGVCAIEYTVGRGGTSEWPREHKEVTEGVGYKGVAEEAQGSGRGSTREWQRAR